MVEQHGQRTALPGTGRYWKRCTDSARKSNVLFTFEDGRIRSAALEWRVSQIQNQLRIDCFENNEYGCITRHVGLSNKFSKDRGCFFSVRILPFQRRIVSGSE